jgi:tetratricopeptide (TPR) repeat protein
MAGSQKLARRRPNPGVSLKLSKSKKKKNLAAAPQNGHSLRETATGEVRQQLKLYEEALSHFQRQKFHRALQLFEKVVDGVNKELGDRARMHFHICEQRLSRSAAPAPRTPEDHYTQGIAMMNLGRWDDARVSLDRALKGAPKADHIVYAMAALDCLTGEAEEAIERLKRAISLRPENRYQARNDPDFAFLQDDPRFTELLYPERSASDE